MPSILYNIMDVFVNYRTMRTRLLGDGYGPGQIGLPVPVTAGGTGTVSLIDRSVLYAGPTGDEVRTDSMFRVSETGNLEVGNVHVSSHESLAESQGTLRVENADLFIDGRVDCLDILDRATLNPVPSPASLERPLRAFQRSAESVQEAQGSWWPRPVVRTFATDVGSFAGAVTTDYGIVLVPYDASSVGLVDTKKKSIETVDLSAKNAEFGSVARFRGGVLTRRGHVVLVPWNATYVGLFDPFARSIAAIPTGTAMPVNGYFGGAMLADGRVVLAPHDADAVLILDETTNIVASVPLPGPSAKYAGAVLLPSGNVCFVPHAAQRVAIMNASGSSVQEVGPVLTGGNKYVGGVLVPSGKVVFVPYQSTHIGVFDPETHETTLVAHGLGSGGGLFAGGLLAPDGKVLFVPHNATSIALFDPETSVVTLVGLPVAFAGTSAKFFGAAVGSDGHDVYLAPHGHPDVCTLGVYPGVTPSLNWSHPFVNNSL
jgi:streptogramin lyase